MQHQVLHQAKRRHQRRPAGVVAPALNRRRPLERVAAERVDEQRVRADARRGEREPDDGHRAVAAIRLGRAPRDPGQRRQHENAVHARRRRHGAGEAARHPPARPKRVEARDGEQQEDALGVDDAEEERERKDRRQQHRAFARGAPADRAAPGNTARPSPGRRPSTRRRCRRDRRSTRRRRTAARRGASASGRRESTRGCCVRLRHSGTRPSRCRSTSPNRSA